MYKTNRIKEITAIRDNRQPLHSMSAAKFREANSLVRTFNSSEHFWLEQNLAENYASANKI
jgi:hypothetical protein